jgi:hypothetical protein
MVYYLVHSLREDCSGIVPLQKKKRLEPLGGDVRVLAHQLALEAGLQLSLLLDLADSGGEDGDGCTG